MENSLNSTSPEPTVQGLKSIFNKPENFYQAFEVSLNESTTAARSNKSEVDLDSTAAPSKALPFKRSRKSLQEPFSVNSNESAVNSDSEQSVTFVKPQSFFSKKNKSLVDFFNVSYNETIGSSQPDGLSKSIDESNIVNKDKNPFKKTNDSQNEISIGNMSSAKNSSKVNNKSHMEESQKTSECSLDGDEADSTTFLTKQNPFKKSTNQKINSESQLHISITDENRSVANETTQPKMNTSMSNSRRANNEDEDTDSTIMKSKLNPFKQAAEVNFDAETSVTKTRDIDTSKENELLNDTREASRSVGLEASIIKLNNMSYLEQSSINDDNLNNWMSDQSDDEMPPPRVPSLTGNLSHTKEKPTASNLPSPRSPAAPSSPVAPNSPAAPSSPTPLSTAATELNPISIWEQKFNEIKSNAERKTQKAKLKMSLNSPQKPNPLKKLDANVGKPPVDQNKYKPQKLMKPAPFATKRLYEYIIKKLEPKYGIDTMLESENLVLSICETVKMVTRRKTHQKRLIQQLKKEMAKAGLIETTMDFYEFVIKFLPYSFRVKVVPCLQPLTNVVYPPKDVLNPFDKIL